MAGGQWAASLSRAEERASPAPRMASARPQWDRLWQEGGSAIRMGRVRWTNLLSLPQTHKDRRFQITPPLPEPGDPHVTPAR